MPDEMDEFKNDVHWMQEALLMAEQALQIDEVPVGAILVRDNKIIGRGWNQVISASDPTAHAEVVAIRDAAQACDNYRVVDTTLYVTLEPCTMCLGSMVHARILRLVYGAPEPRAGVVQSQAQLLDEVFFNHNITYTAGVLAEPCGELISGYFRAKRR